LQRISNRQIAKKLQGFRDDSLTGAPELHIGDSVNNKRQRNVTKRIISKYVYDVSQKLQITWLKKFDSSIFICPV